MLRMDVYMHVKCFWIFFFSFRETMRGKRAKAIFRNKGTNKQKKPIVIVIVILLLLFSQMMLIYISESCISYPEKLVTPSNNFAVPRSL